MFLYIIKASLNKFQSRVDQMINFIKKFDEKEENLGFFILEGGVF